MIGGRLDLNGFIVVPDLTKELYQNKLTEVSLRSTTPFQTAPFASFFNVI